MSAGSKRTKRNRSNRKYNRNALDHGFYYSALCPDEKRRFLNLVSEDPIDPETLMRNIKIQSLLWQIPSPPYALGAISRLTAKCSAEHYRMAEAESFPETAENQKTNQSHSRLMQNMQNKSNQKTNGEGTGVNMTEKRISLKNSNCFSLYGKYTPLLASNPGICL